MNRTRRWLVPTRRWNWRGWEINATRAHPPKPWKPRLRRVRTVLARGADFRWLTIYVWWRKWR